MDLEGMVLLAALALAAVVVAGVALIIPGRARRERQGQGTAGACQESVAQAGETIEEIMPPSTGLLQLANKTRTMLDAIRQQEREKYSKLADVTALRAVIQAIPYVGSSLDTLIFSKADKIRRHRLLEYLDAIHEFMTRLDREKVDERFFETERGLSVFEAALRAATQEAVEEKRRVLGAFTVGSGTRDLSLRDDHLFVLECVGKMSISQVVVLLRLAREQLRIAQEQGVAPWGRIRRAGTVADLHYTDVAERAWRALDEHQVAPEASVDEILDGLMSLNLIGFPEEVDYEELGGRLRYDCLAVTDLGGRVYSYLALYHEQSAGASS